MSKVIIFSQQDGRLAIVTPAPNSRMLLPRPGYPPILEPEMYWLQRIAAQAVPQTAQDAHVIDSGALPADMTFYDAWRHNAGVVHVDMPMARELHRAALRQARQPMLEQLDVEYQRAHERDDKEHMQTVAAAKQALRDVTSHPDIEGAQTPEQLKAIWPFETKNPDPPPVKQFSTVSASVPLQVPAPDNGPGWVGRLVGKIDAANDPSIGPVPLPQEEAAPEVPAYLPPPTEPAPAPADDNSRRRAAKAHIRRIAAEYAFDANAEALRYEQALLAHNGNTAAIEDLEMEAMTKGVSVDQLAQQIIDGRRLHSRRMVMVKRIHDDALTALDNAHGDEIGAIETKAVAEMSG
jgi:hypothetical protein